MENSYITENKRIHDSIDWINPQPLILSQRQTNNNHMELVVKRCVNGVPIENVGDYIIESNAINDVIHSVNQRLD